MNEMKPPLRLLLVEDSSDDAELILRELHRAGYDPQGERVETRRAMAAALDGGQWDIILCDYSLPHFSAPAALETLKETGLDLPFIIVSGAIGEDTAVEMMRAGAHDYVMKGHLARLAPAIGRELAEAEQRRKRRRAEQALRNSEEQFRQIAGNVRHGMWVQDARTNVMLYVSPACAQILGRTVDDLMTDPAVWGEVIHPEDTWDPATPGWEATESVYRVIHKDGAVRWVNDLTVPVRDESGQLVRIVGIVEDITDRKRAEEEIANLAKFPSENPDPVLRISADGTVLYANAASEGLLAALDSGVGQPAPAVWRDRVSWSLAEGAVWHEALTHGGRVLSFSAVPVPADQYVNLYGRDVTERRHAEDELRLLSLRQEAILASVPDIIMEVDNRKVYTWANQAGLEFFGPDVLGKEAAYYFEGEQDTYDVVQSLFEGSEETIYVESWQRRRDGAKRLLAWWCRVLKDSRGHVTGTLATARDITEHKRAEEDLRRSEERYRAVAEDMPVLICRFLPDGEITYVNGSYCRYFDKTSDELVGASFLSLIPEADRQTVMDNIRALTVDSPSQSHEHRVHAPDGEIRWQRWTNRALFDADGQPVAYQSLGEDITDRKQAEEALREREHFVSKVIESELNGVYIYDLDRRTNVYINPAYTELVGYSLQDLNALPPEQFAEFFHPDDRAAIAEHMEQIALLPDGEVLEIEYRFKAAGGQWIWCLSRDAVFDRDQRGNVRQFIGTFLDITDRRSAEEQIRQARARLEIALQSGNIGIWDWNMATNEVYFSPEWKAQLGYADDELAGAYEEWESRLHPDDRARTLQALREYIEGRTDQYVVEFRLRHRDGSYRWILARGEMVHDRLGKPVRMTGCHLDLTDHRQLEEQFLQSQKMEAIGQLAGGVAHDFRNQLQVIEGFTSMVLRRGLVTDEGRAKLEQVLDAAERSSHLSNQLLAFSRQGTLRPEILDPRDLVRDLRTSLPQMLGEDVRLVVSSGDEPLRVELDAVHFHQAMINLCLNARDAMPRGGDLSVDLATVELDEAFVQQYEDITPGTYVVVSVRDSGVGMDPETRARVFDPFFTTKETGKGTGLGLSMVYGFVRRSGGVITCESQLGVGTTFRMYFPTVAASAAKPATEQEPLRLPPGTGRVMLVEDEDMLRRLLAEYLTEAGFEVVQASCPDEALRELSQRTKPLDVLVTDVVMPGMSGLDLAARAVELRPDMKVIYISGYADEELERRGLTELSAILLQKPFDPKLLLARLAEMLG